MLKVTVLKKTYFEDIVDEYAVSKEEYGLCDLMEEGQSFLVNADDPCPTGFCEYAWGNIQQELHNAQNGISLPWVKQERTFIACCTDGFRPVIFKIEPQCQG